MYEAGIMRRQHSGITVSLLKKVWVLVFLATVVTSEARLVRGTIAGHQRQGVNQNSPLQK
jgi:hypothetical protein